MTRRELIGAMTVAGATFVVRRGDAMQRLEKIRILFVAGFGPIVRDADASRKLYVEALNIPFKEESGGYLHTGALQGAKEFALWPLSQAAESCFGNSTWPDSLLPPHAWLEFDVDSVESATAELESQGYRMLIKNKKEPWGQTVSRFLDPNGLLVGLTFTLWMREKK
jgi:catechol 2,3-dioxygenase-like lactoylglutathione lyase family enzyme